MNNTVATAEPQRNVTAFFVLTLVLTIPIWILAAITYPALPEEVPVTPFVFVVVFVPLASALILTYRANGSEGAKELLRRSFDYKRITRKIWYVPIFVLWPVIFSLGYGLLVLLDPSLTATESLFPLAFAPILFAVFFFSALAEQVGWQGYAYDPMENRWNALQASIVLGLFWGLWHIPFYVMLPNIDPVWIVGQIPFLILVRILIVWIFNNTGKSVFAAILFHAVYNVCTQLFPNYSLPLGPLATGIVALPVVIVVIYLWGADTLAQYRFSKKEQRITA